MRRPKPRSFLMLAYAAGAMVPLLHMLLRWGLGLDRFPDEPKQPPLRTWLRQYRSSRQRERALVGILGFDMNSARWQQLLGRGSAASPLMELPVPEDEIHKLLAELAPQLGDAEFKKRLQVLLESPAGQFELRVGLPCAVLYREHPIRLLRRARLGDLEAFETLLLLDKSVHFDPGLARRWHELLQHPKPSVRKRLFAALAGRPRKRVDEKSIRTALAGILSGRAQDAGSSVRAAEVRSVFTFFTADGYLDTADMPAGEALTKAIQRHRPRPRKPASREAPGQ